MLHPVNNSPSKFSDPNMVVLKFRGLPTARSQNLPLGAMLTFKWKRILLGLKNLWAERTERYGWKINWSDSTYRDVDIVHLQMTVASAWVPLYQTQVMIMSSKILLTWKLEHLIWCCTYTMQSTRNRQSSQAFPTSILWSPSAIRTGGGKGLGMSK